MCKNDEERRQIDRVSGRQSFRYLVCQGTYFKQIEI